MTEFLIWIITIELVGLCFMPMTMGLFYKFKDKGWMFAKVIGLFIGGYVLWLLSTAHLVKFTTMNSVLVVLVCGVMNYLALFFFCAKKGKQIEMPKWSLVIVEEGLFLAVFAFWMFLVGFDPAAYGTEKFMDYGYMTSMMRSEYLPPADMWYAGETMNYYYGGQYLATFLTKLADITAGYGYNLMRMMIGSLAFVLPFSIVYQLMETVQQRKTQKSKGWICIITGILSGLAVSVCSNMQYVVYGIFIPLWQRITGNADAITSYWYPNATRYIGYAPDGPDKGITEFPAYSTVLGDLHAHMANLIFAIAVVGIMLAWLLQQREHSLMADQPFKAKAEKKTEKGKKNKKDWKNKQKLRIRLILKDALLQPHIIVLGFFTGMFRFTNFWDFPIYFVTGGCIVFFWNMRKYKNSLKLFCIATLAQVVEVLAVGYVACLPFILDFEKIASVILFCEGHSKLYQWLVLWALPVGIVGTFICGCIWRYMRNKGAARNENLKKINKKSNKKNEDSENIKEKKSILKFFNSLPKDDLFLVLIGMCAIGLVLVPEVIYIDDIYGGDNYRANTVFKLTYQAFILFGMLMPCILMRGLMYCRKLGKVLASVGTVLLLLTACYMYPAIKGQFGNIFDLSNWKTMDASYFLKESFPSDEGGVYWLNTQVEGQPVILEANGDSYTGYGRVSVATGLPTVLGWYVHEWLWRSDLEDTNQRVADIETIYTSTDEDEVKALIQKYNIEYIYIGTYEREKFENLNDTLLQEIGEVAYSNGVDCYIMDVRELV